MRAKIHFVIIIIALICLGVTLASAATVTSKANGLWSDVSTWNTNNVPTVIDSVIIRAQDSVAITTGPTACKSLNVLGKISDTVASVSSGGQGELTVTNVLTLASGSYFFLGIKLNALPAAAIKNIDNASTLVLYGTQSSVAETNVGNLWIKTTAGGISFAGNMTINGNLTCRMSGSANSIKGTTSTSGSLTHIVMGNVYIYAGIFNAVDVGTPTTIGIWNIRGDVLVSSDGGVSALARMGPFASASPAGIGIFNIDGDLTIDNGGRFQGGNSSTGGKGVGIINLKGDLTFTSTGAVNANNIIGGLAINFVGTSLQTVTNNMASSFSSQNPLYDTVAVGASVLFNNGSRGWGQSAADSGTGKFVVLGTLDLDTCRINGYQNVEFKGGATLKTGTASGFKGNLTTTGTKTLDTTANYTYDGSVAQAGDSLLPSAVKNLTINNSSGVTLVRSMTTINGVLGLDSGVLDNTLNAVRLGPSGSVRWGGGSVAVAIPGVSVEEIYTATPRKFQLYNNFPNPFNPSTEIRFSVQRDGYATLKVFNLLGQEVATLFDGIARAGQYIPATFNADKMASGVYFARLEQNGKSMVQRMVLAK